jgi:hypothetical protein
MAAVCDTIVHAATSLQARPDAVSRSFNGPTPHHQSTAPAGKSYKVYQSPNTENQVMYNVYTADQFPANGLEDHKAFRGEISRILRYKVRAHLRVYYFIAYQWYYAPFQPLADGRWPLYFGQVTADSPYESNATAHVFDAGDKGLQGRRIHLMEWTSAPHWIREKIDVL